MEAESPGLQGKCQLIVCLYCPRYESIVGLSLDKGRERSAGSRETMSIEYSFFILTNAARKYYAESAGVHIYLIG